MYITGKPFRGEAGLFGGGGGAFPLPPPVERTLATIASCGQSLVQGRSMAENVLGLVLRQHRFFFFFFYHLSVSSPENIVFHVAIFMDGSGRYCSKIIRAVLE